MFDGDSHRSELENQLSYGDCTKIIDDLYNTTRYLNSKANIHFTGGDPLLRKDFFDIAKYAVDKEIPFGILGNPYHLTKQNIKKLKQLNILRYQISLDGLEKTHDSIRKSGSFKDSINALRLLKKSGIKTNIMFTLSRINSDELIDVIRLVAKEGFSSFAFDRLTPFGHGKDIKESILSPSELKDILIKCEDEFVRLENLGTSTTFIRKIHLFNILEKRKELIKPTKKNIIYAGCSIGINGLAVLSDGTVYPCRRLPIKIGNVPEQSLKDIFLHSELLNKMRNIQNYEKCKKCESAQFCRGCPSIAYAVTGDCFGSDPQCWKRV